MKRLSTIKDAELIKQRLQQGELLAYPTEAVLGLGCDPDNEIFSSWPGPMTWLLPAAKQAPKWVTGDSDLIAVRVSQHLVVSQLCELFGKPLISTSANVSGVKPAINAAQLYQQFDKTLLLVDGALGGANKPSQIRHGISGQTIRDN